MNPTSQVKLSEIHEFDHCNYTDLTSLKQIPINKSDLTVLQYNIKYLINIHNE